MTDKPEKPLLAPWLRPRDEAELERERRHKLLLQKFEADAIAAGLRVRLKKATKPKGDSDGP